MVGPKVSILGRPNVGKSTLFNQLAGRRLAIVENVPGVTRDRKTAQARLGDFHFVLTDTPGFEELSPRDARNPDEDVKRGMLAQAKAALADSDVVLLMFDAREGITQGDLDLAEWLRDNAVRKGCAELGRSDVDVPVLLVANKCDTKKGEDQMMEGLLLGFGVPAAVSASQGVGLRDLHDKMLQSIESMSEEAKQDLLRRAREELSRRKASIAPVVRLDLKEAGEEEEDGEEECTTAESQQSEEDKEKAEKELSLLCDPLWRPDLPPEDVDSVLQFAVAGRPNVGKSTLINALLQEDRLLCGPIPGITRDPIAVDLQYKEQQFKLIDTAGIVGLKHSQQRKSEKVDQLAMEESLRAINYANVVGLVLDVQEEMVANVPEFEQEWDPFREKRAVDKRSTSEARELGVRLFTKRDIALANYALDEGKALVVLVNKWDLIERRFNGAEVKLGIRDVVSRSLSQVKGVPVMPLSAREGRNLKQVLPMVLQMHDKWNLRVSTGRLNKWLRTLLEYKPIPTQKGRPVKIRYITQASIRPPTFAIFTNSLDIPDSYQRFLTNALREEFDMEGVPVRLSFKKTVKENPYATRSGSKQKYLSKKMKKRKGKRSKIESFVDGMSVS